MFRVRSRLTNGHSPWSIIFEGLTVEKSGKILSKFYSYFLGNLIEASRPNNLQIIPLNANSVEVRWLPPTSLTKINAYEVTAQEIGGEGKLYRDKISGSIFSHTFKKLSPTTKLNITVQAISNSWTNGERAFKEFQFPTLVEGRDVGGLFESTTMTANKHEQKSGLQMTNIQVEEVGEKIAVSWQISKDSSNVRAYQVLFFFFK